LGDARYLFCLNPIKFAQIESILPKFSPYLINFAKKILPHPHHPASKHHAHCTAAATVQRGSLVPIETVEQAKKQYKNSFKIANF